MIDCNMVHEALTNHYKKKIIGWLKNIADNQLAIAPMDLNAFMSLDEHMEAHYKKGVYDGLQMAWDIITSDEDVSQWANDRKEAK